MKNTLRDRLVRQAFYSLVPLAWCATSGVALASPAAGSATSVTHEAPPEDLTVQGSVVDARGDALPGVNILLKGSSRGTVTDAQGRFSLKVPGAGATRGTVYARIGVKTQGVNEWIFSPAQNITL